MMKIFKADIELEKKLLQHGFILTSSRRSEQSGLKQLSFSKAHAKQVVFNKVCIEFINDHVVEDRRAFLNETEFNMLLLYFQLRTAEEKFLTPQGFKIKKAVKAISALEVKSKGSLKSQQSNIEKTILKKWHSIKSHNEESLIFSL